MRIQVNDAGIIINSMGHPLDPRKVCESYNKMRDALEAIKIRASCAPNDDANEAGNQFTKIIAITQRATAQ